MWSKNEFEIKRALEKIDNIIKKFNQTDFLLLLSRVSQKMYKDRVSIIENKGHMITIWLLIYLAKEVLLNTSDRRSRNIDDDSLNLLSEIYNSISDSVVDREKKDSLCIIIKMTYEQGFWQFRVNKFLPRNLLLFNITDKPLVQKHQMKFSSLFKKHTGLGIGEFIILSFVSWMNTGNSGGYFNPNFITKSKMERYKHITTAENVAKFLDHISISNVDFRHRQKKLCSKDWREKKYEFNLLRRYPIIKNSQNELLAPIPRMLLDRCTSGLYYDMLDFYNIEQGKPYEFTKSYGEIFEEYIGKLLCEYYVLDESLFKSDDYFDDNYNGKKPDWIIAEEDNIILVECKSSRLPLKVIQSSNIADFRDYFRKHYLKDGRFQFNDAYNYIKKLNPDKKIFSLMVINDIPTFYNNLHMFFESDNFIDEIETLNIQFMTIDELEYLIPNLANHSISDVMKLKINNNDLIHEPFSELYKKLENFNWGLNIKLLKEVEDEFFGFEL